MRKIVEEKWVIVSKDRKLIVKGAAGSRALHYIDDPKCKKRISYYSSAGIAKNGIYGISCYAVRDYITENYGNSYETRRMIADLEVIKVLLTTHFVGDDGNFI